MSCIEKTLNKNHFRLVITHSVLIIVRHSDDTASLIGAMKGHVTGERSAVSDAPTSTGIDLLKHALRPTSQRTTPSKVNSSWTLLNQLPRDPTPYIY